MRNCNIPVQVSGRAGGSFRGKVQVKTLPIECAQAGPLSCLCCASLLLHVLACPFSEFSVRISSMPMSDHSQLLQHQKLFTSKVFIRQNLFASQDFTLTPLILRQKQNLSKPFALEKHFTLYTKQLFCHTPFALHVFTPECFFPAKFFRTRNAFTHTSSRSLSHNTKKILTWNVFTVAKPFTPKNFDTRSSLHHKPFTPEALSRRNLCTESFCARDILHHFTPNSFCARNFVHHMPFASEANCATSLFHTTCILHRKPFTPETFDTTAPLQQKHLHQKLLNFALQKCNRTTRIQRHPGMQKAVRMHWSSAALRCKTQRNYPHTKVPYTAPSNPGMQNTLRIYTPIQHHSKRHNACTAARPAPAISQRHSKTAFRLRLVSQNGSGTVQE